MEESETTRFASNSSIPSDAFSQATTLLASCHRGEQVYEEMEKKLSLSSERQREAMDKNSTRELAIDTPSYRARLRRRLLDGAGDALTDHEVIEYLLMTAIPRQDVKPLARALLQRFGSLAAVFNAEPRTLMTTPGIQETAAASLRIAAVSARRLAKSIVAEKRLLSTSAALLDYLHIDMAHLTHERVRVLYLDTQNRLILDQLVSDGTLDEATFYTREIIAKAMAIGAAALILVHNHPSGNPEPSRADIRITHKLIEVGRLLDITIQDHVIIGKEGYTSLKAQGMI